MTLHLLPNIGAEEPPPKSKPPAVALMADLFRGLFAANVEVVGDASPPFLPSDGAAYPWLDAEDGLFAWLNTPVAAREAEARGVPLLGPSPDVVRRVHDKAFTWRFAREEGFEPRALRGLSALFEPHDLESPDAVAERIDAVVREWPEWIGGRFTLKPRMGGSGRGRLGGTQGRPVKELAGSLPRFARQGGLVLEPWLERRIDLSAQLYIEPGGDITLLACFEQLISQPGVYQGHRGQLDHRLRITSGTAHDADVLEAATALARAAHAEGFHGPCGIDAFVFAGPEGDVLRPVVELNARFTTGTVLAGWIRQLGPAIERDVPAPPGETRRFDLSLAAPAAGWPEPSPPDRAVFELRPEKDGLHPCLVVQRD